MNNSLCGTKLYDLCGEYYTLSFYLLRYSVEHLFAIFVPLASFDAQTRHGRPAREGWSSFK